MVRNQPDNRSKYEIDEKIPKTLNKVVCLVLKRQKVEDEAGN